MASFLRRKSYNSPLVLITPSKEPTTLLRLKPEHDLAVIEMGANHPGEIKFLCEIAEPDYGIITNVGKAHLEGFGFKRNRVVGTPMWLLRLPKV